ncbi:ABC transporter, permease protein 2 (cluster 5, nickel/peptides/opines), partial [hydrothermal vent metagenome]
MSEITDRNAPGELPADQPLPHYVNPAPFDAYSAEKLTPEQEKFYLASQWTMMWFKFRRHKLAVVSAVFLALSYASILVSEFIAPYGLEYRAKENLHSPPQRIRLFHEGKFVGPFVYPLEGKPNLETFQWDFTENSSKPQKIRFMCSGDPYKFWGMWEMDFHFVCPPEDGTLFLLGTDRLGRDMFSRITYGTRISLTVGLLGITISFLFGIILGGLSGYYGGWIDNVIQRVIEIIRSLPELPLWLALSAALPVTWSPILVFLGITVILGLLDWPGLARAVRSKLLALREEDFATAAVLMGAKPKRVIARHLLPSFASHLIASASLSIPGMILGETALSFLGLGLRPPITSWGVLLNEAQNLTAIEFYPWILTPMI